MLGFGFRPKYPKTRSNVFSLNPEVRAETGQFQTQAIQRMHFDSSILKFLTSIAPTGHFFAHEPHCLQT